MFVSVVTPAERVVTFDYRAAGGHHGVVMCAGITSLLKDHPVGQVGSLKLHAEMLCLLVPSAAAHR